MSDLDYEIEEAIIEYADLDNVAYLQNDAHRAMLAGIITRRLQEKGLGSQASKAELDGLDVELSRANRDGKLVVDISTIDLQERDVHPEHQIPNIRIRINEQGLELRPDGTLYDSEEGREV